MKNLIWNHYINTIGIQDKVRAELRIFPHHYLATTYNYILKVDVQRSFFINQFLDQNTQMANRPNLLAASPSHTLLGPTTFRSVSKSEAFCRSARSSARGLCDFKFVGLDLRTSNESEKSFAVNAILLFK